MWLSLSTVFNGMWLNIGDNLFTAFTKFKEVRLLKFNCRIAATNILNISIVPLVILFQSCLPPTPTRFNQQIEIKKQYFWRFQAVVTKARKNLCIQKIIIEKRSEAMQECKKEIFTFYFKANVWNISQLFKAKFMLTKWKNM